MKLYGNSLPSELFRVIEDNIIPDFNQINKILTSGRDFNGCPPAYVVRNFLPRDQCLKIERNFLKIIENSGGHRIEDFVKVDQVGSTQFQKTSTAYIDDCMKSRKQVLSLFEDISAECVKDFLLEDSLKNFFLQQSIHFGPSSYQGRNCNLLTARLWKNDNGLALLPHEDLAQLELAKSDGYEIGNVKDVIAVNLCIQNAENAELLLWNINPSSESKKELGLTHTGYPYPVELLENFKCLSIKTSPGDLYFINANHIHAVTDTKNGKRVSIGRFMGYIASNKIVYWT